MAMKSEYERRTERVENRLHYTPHHFTLRDVRTTLAPPTGAQQKLAACSVMQRPVLSDTSIQMTWIATWLLGSFFNRKWTVYHSKSCTRLKGIFSHFPAPKLLLYLARSALYLRSAFVQCDTRHSLTDSQSSV
jgi:hypothetical protein